MMKDLIAIASLIGNSHELALKTETEFTSLVLGEAIYAVTDWIISKNE